MINALKNGEVFSGCKILSRCGKGAYGVVYLAENVISQKIVIKIIEKTATSDRELRGLHHYTRISEPHPHLLRIFHIGEFEGGFYYTMEAADNLAEDKEHDYFPATLGNLLKLKKQFTPAEAVTVVRDLLEGLETLHAANLIHRDIKPDNIIFVNGKAKLSDPGLVVDADATATLAGTPGFIPPEIIANDLPSDRKSDLYALGKVFYCLVTGNKPNDYPHLPDQMPVEVRRQLFPSLARMCNSNPAKRFDSAQEFLKSLPVAIAEPTWLDRKKNAFRDWKNLNQEKYRFCQRALLTFAAVLLLGAAALGACAIYRHTFIANCEKETRNFLSINGDRRELIGFQIENYLPELFKEYTALDEELTRAVKDEDWHTAFKTSLKLRKFLGAAAEKLLPEIPAESKDWQEEIAVAGRAAGFLATPLSCYLSEGSKKGFEKRTALHQNRIYTNWSGPRCGKNWVGLDNTYYPLIFLPPGAVKMDHSGKTVKIPYHFWICRDETSAQHFTWLTGIKPQFSANLGTPVERITWNDMLYYCHALTEVMRKRETLPPGYIIRPPSEAEWEYAAKNGWLGKDTSPLEERAVVKENSSQSVARPGTKLASKLGLFDIWGNLTELVCPLEPPAMQNAVVSRGGSFMSSKKNVNRRTPVLKYQNIPYTQGFRFVLAPGDMSYFDRHFFTGGPTQVKTHGKVFELIGENYGAVNWKKAEKLARLLGGRLGELDSPELFDTVTSKMPLMTSSWVCFLGGRKINGKWRWLSTQKEVDFGQWHKSRTPEKEQELSLKGKKWLGTLNQTSAIFLCEWDEKSFPERNKQINGKKPLPFEVHRFNAGNRRYILFNAHMGWYSSRRICELLGGRLACLDTPALLEEVKKQLAPWKERRVFLGAYAKRDQWFWLNGKEITAQISPPDTMLIQTRNKNFLALHQNAFQNSQFAQFFLCEWLEDISSPTLR